MGCRTRDIRAAGLGICWLQGYVYEGCRARECGLQGYGYVGCSARDILAAGLGIYFLRTKKLNFEQFSRRATVV